MSFEGDDMRSATRKWVVVRANSTHGPWIVERNSAAPRPLGPWCLADIRGYADTRREALASARRGNARIGGAS